MTVDWNKEIHRMAADQDYLYLPGVREAEEAMKAAAAIIRERSPSVPVSELEGLAEKWVSEGPDYECREMLAAELRSLISKHAGND